MLKRLKKSGPGAMVAAAFIGPGTVTTATIAGASYGYTLLWAITFSIFGTFILQEMASRLGVAGQMGVGVALRQKITHPLGKILATMLVVSAVFIGNAAYEAGNITGAVLGFDESIKQITQLDWNPLVLVIGLSAFLLLMTGSYSFIEKGITALVGIMGLVFFVCALLVGPDWGAILKGLFAPVLPEGALLMVVGLIGTTIVPYNLFLHASAANKRWTKSEEALSDSRYDTLFSVIFGGLITMSILITSAVAFQQSEQDSFSLTTLMNQLNPILGNWSSTFIAIGFLAAGLSSAVTAPLAAAFAVSEVLGWQGDMRSSKFRAVWLLVLLCGVLFASLGIRPVQLILLAQVANGLLLPIIAGFLLWIMNDATIMGNHKNTVRRNLLGGLIILITLLLGAKSIMGVVW